MCVCVCSHDATLALVCMRVFKAKSVLGAIFLQVGELFAVNGSTALPETRINSSTVKKDDIYIYICMYFVFVIIYYYILL